MTSTISPCDKHNDRTMASPGRIQPRAILRHGNLYTPEEPLEHSFSKASGEASGLPNLAPIQTLSPPVSPEAKALPSFQYPAADAPLYPEPGFNDASDSESPLFSSVCSQESLLTPPQPPRRLTFEERAERAGISNLGKFVGPDYYLPPKRNAAIEYYHSNMAELEDIQRMIRQKAQLPPPSQSHAVPRDPTSARQLASLGKFATGGKSTGIAKSRPATKTVASPKVALKSKATRAESPAKAATPRKRTPRAQTAEEFHDRAFPQQQSQPKHKRAAPTKKVEGKEDDSTWRELPDFCPPIDTLQDSSKPLKAQWKGNPLDIHDEPDREVLHQAEYDVASELRLRPQQYLANKRRMFMARVRYLREKKTFTKTAAQNATNIDVNKTSRLWEAYDRVGWFEESLFQQHMEEDEEEENEEVDEKMTE
ncbi:hypothetical protein B0A50_06935 [Salinomyces thailandicus]|uniref:SWIRM domain-containing protein n=1 Tax=Salinomyces thailandicus TaxID=706561 RepID=A0A4U0TPS0_9PEZI|nr:hypothetical protein B0A50_06935 [Salinomyces thailandica]